MTHVWLLYREYDDEQYLRGVYWTAEGAKRDAPPDLKWTPHFVEEDVTECTWWFAEVDEHVSWLITKVEPEQ